MLRKLFATYVIGLPLLHALSPTPSITIDLLLSAFCLFAMLFLANKRHGAIGFQQSDFVFAFIYILGLMPLLLVPSSVGVQNLKYAGLFLAVWFLNCWWIREWMSAARISIQDVSKYAAWACLFLAFAVYFEVLSANILGLYVSDFIPFSISEFPKATILGSSFQRPRVFSSEAGFTSIAFECLLPLATINLHTNMRKMALFLALVLPGYVFLGSATSFLGFAIVLLVFSVVIGRNSPGTWFLVLVLGLVIGFLAFTETGQYLYEEIIGRKIVALITTPDNVGNNAFGRADAFAFGVHILSNNIFGIGWGSVSQANFDSAKIYGQFVVSSGLISLFLEIAVACGLLGLLLTLYLIVVKLIRLTVRNTYAARAAFFSLLWVSIHHAFVFEFWFPMIWFSLAFSDHVLRQVAVPQVHRPVNPGMVRAPRRAVSFR